MKLNESGKEPPVFLKQRPLVIAFRFRLSMSLENLRCYLSERMKNEWVVGDTEYFGDYVGIKKKGTQTIIRIFNQNDGFLVDLLNRIPLEESKWLHEIEELQTILKEGGGEEFTPAENNY